MSQEPPRPKRVDDLPDEMMNISIGMWMKDADAYMDHLEQRNRELEADLAKMKKVALFNKGEADGTHDRNTHLLGHIEGLTKANRALHDKIDWMKEHRQ